MIKTRRRLSIYLIAMMHSFRQLPHEKVNIFAGDGRYKMVNEDVSWGHLSGQVSRGSEWPERGDGSDGRLDDGVKEEGMGKGRGFRADLG